MFHLLIILGENMVPDNFEITRSKVTRVTFVINYVKQFSPNIFKTIVLSLQAITPFPFAKSIIPILLLQSFYNRLRYTLVTRLYQIPFPTIGARGHMCRSTLLVSICSQFYFSFRCLRWIRNWTKFLFYCTRWSKSARL